MNTVNLGRQGEVLALRLLKDSIDMNVLTNNPPFDIMWGDKRIDVKVSLEHKQYYWRHEKDVSTHWHFSVKNKGSKYCDYFLCIGLSDTFQLVQAYLIPFEASPKNGVCMSTKRSKYDIYKIQGIQDANECYTTGSPFDGIL